jgi:oligosaccharide repeat unit polymerase
MIPAVLYLILVAVYVPGLLYLFRGRFYRYPLISFCFLGLFVQNALGSILVAYPALVGRELFSPIVGERGYFSYTFAGMLLVQALVFYLVTGYYMATSRTEVPVFRLDRSADRITLAALLAGSLALVAGYIAQVGSPPMLEIVRGNIIGSDIVRYRVESTFALDNYAVFFLGLYAMPLLITGYAFTLALQSRRRLGYLGVIGLCSIIAMLPGTKGVMLDVATVLIIVYLLYCAGYTGAPPRQIAFRKIGMGIGAAFVPVVFMYRAYGGAGGSGGSVSEMLSNMAYRILGVNSESMAATVTYTRILGFLDGKTFPTVRGLLTHVRVDTSEEMHQFMFGPGGGVPISAVSEGYLNFGWPGFLVFCFVTFGIVVLAEWFFRRMPRNLYTFALLVLYVLFATKLSQVSLFATFVSLTYVPAFTAFFAVRAVLAGFAARRPALAFSPRPGEAT